MIRSPRCAASTDPRPSATVVAPTPGSAPSTTMDWCSSGSTARPTDASSSWRRCSILDSPGLSRPPVTVYSARRHPPWGPAAPGGSAPPR
ncbi:hypothetical protein ACFQXA_18445 [Nocardiopsis composta]